MKHLLTLTLCLGIAWGQNITEGTGLELETINDFAIVVEPYDDFPHYKNLGLTAEYIETKVKLTLRSNGIIPSPSGRTKYLYVNINMKMINDMGYVGDVSIDFRRPVQYPLSDDNYVFRKFNEVDNVRYQYSAVTYHDSALFTTPQEGALDYIVSVLVTKIDKFSLALLEANEK